MDETIAYQKAILLVKRANRLLKQGLLSDAIQVFEQSIEIYPTAEGYTNLGWAFSMVQRYDEAIEQCKLAIEVDPERGNAYNDIGVYLLSLERAEEAVSWFKKSLKVPEYDARHYAYCNLGRAYENLGRYESALRYYDLALQINGMYMNALQRKQLLLGKLN